MAGRSVPVVLIPRFTTYVGAGTFPTLPIPVAAYDALVVNVLVGPLVGTTPSGALACQESNDLVTWTNCSGTPTFWPTAFVEAQFRFDLTKAWMRYALVLGGSQPGVTASAEGYFELREK